jgi:hypothetical protein
MISLAGYDDVVDVETVVVDGGADDFVNLLAVVDEWLD